MNISKARAVLVINTLFHRLPTLSGAAFRSGADLLQRECATSEREHRKGWSRYGKSPRGFSADVAGRYFAVKYLHDYMTSDKAPSVADYLSIRHECFTAAALVLQNREALQTWCADELFGEFTQIDYVEMME